MTEVEVFGGPEPGPVTLVPYDPGWPARFERERERIVAALGERALAVEHVGSTSVPGLAAKPIVDIDLAVADVEEEAAFVPALEGAGYVLRARERGHRLLRTPERDVNLHVWTAGDENMARDLRFRERLRASPEDRAAYEARKRELAVRDWAELQDYADAKGPLIAEIAARGSSPDR
ncbi:MAG TPA: GrpB family protein [Solirubrobacteraceae bacterium]|nr:GrpB family protein [Solirubrobacteraceae bacterium]